FLFEIIFYHSRNGESEIENYLDELKQKSETSKTDRINRTKILSHLSALSRYGTRIGQSTVKHIEGSIWELRPLSNRIFFFHWKDNKFVLLHHFVKKSQKTPPREIEQARLKLKDFLERSDEK
ncbi:type II toxin-antitoxin system RelE/ParE family toxin, partial [Eubacterium aggregans]|uniref:type II toxin-antitoxin system RelE/ParE family toxin n=1 Tax=Eubacterium aggregans TaxID=81409 RepID=UPI003F3CD633